MSIIKLSEVYPEILEVTLKSKLTSIHIKTIPNLYVDEKPKTKRGAKIMKRWYTSLSDFILKIPAFCKEYIYEDLGNGRLKVTTEVIYFDTNGDVFHKEVFVEVWAKNIASDFKSKIRSFQINELSSDAEGITGVNGKGDVSRIFKRYKNQIENYIFRAENYTDIVGAIENETNAGILNLLNVELPVYYIDNVYEEALSEDVIFPIIFNLIGLNPVKEDLTMKTQEEIAIELLGLGLDITNPATALPNMLAYLTSQGFDVRIINIGQIFSELVSTSELWIS